MRTTLDRAVFHPDAADVPAIINKANGYRFKSEDAWKQYKALPMNAEEARLTADVEAKRAALFRDGIEPLMSALRARDAAAADVGQVKNGTKKPGSAAVVATLASSACITSSASDCSE
nr:Tar ligand binding domain-containing protein [Ralstonia syzygii]